jgi:hypothetical protein
MDIMREAEELALHESGAPEVKCSMIWDANELQGVIGFVGKLEQHLQGILSKKDALIDNCGHVCLGSPDEMDACPNHHDSAREDGIEAEQAAQHDNFN